MEESGSESWSDRGQNSSNGVYYLAILVIFVIIIMVSVYMFRRSTSIYLPGQVLIYQDDKPEVAALKQDLAVFINKLQRNVCQNEDQLKLLQQQLAISLFGVPCDSLQSQLAMVYMGSSLADTYDLSSIPVDGAMSSVEGKQVQKSLINLLLAYSNGICNELNSLPAEARSAKAMEIARLIIRSGCDVDLGGYAANGFIAYLLNLFNAAPLKSYSPEQVNLAIAQFNQ